MALFLRVFECARDSVTLVYPTRDEKGQEILRAGFLDDLIRVINRDATEKVHECRTRIEPTLLNFPELAGAPADARVRAVAIACANEDTTELAQLAANPRHRPALEGVAIALELESARSSRTRGFTPYEGRLDQAGVVASVARGFGPDRTFSPSQLETYLTCPFRFFLRYVLDLDPLAELADLDDDPTERGRRVHNALEELERRRLLDAQNVLNLDVIRATSEVRAELTGGSDVDPGRQEIESRWLAKTLERYALQARQHSGKEEGNGPAPRHFEVEFGAEQVGESYPNLVIGQGEAAVKLRGTIDRVDVVSRDGETLFRVIDYKTGAAPTKSEIDAMFVLQLPIYARAVEALGIAGEEARLLDVGYWELGEKGYKRFEVKDWPAFQAKIEAKVIATATAIRGGRFVVAPREKDCTRSCDYRTVCRIQQVRNATKASDGEVQP